MVSIKMTSRLLPALSSNNGVYGSALWRPLQRSFWKSAKEKEADEACKKAKETTESLKQGAEHVKDTTESIKDMATATSKTVTDMTKEVSKKMSETTDDIVKKMKDPVKGAMSDAWKKTTKNIEDKVAEKIRDRVMGKEEQEKSAGKKFD